MRYYQAILLSLFLFFSSCVFSVERSWFDEPIKVNHTYIEDVESVILESLKQRGWEVKNKSPGIVTAWLNDYKGYELVLEIKYNKSLISFNQLSFKKVNCKARCKVWTKYSDKWRLYLRRNIAMNIHKHTMDNLLQNKNIRKVWLDKLKKGSVKYKTKLARNLINIEYFNEYALAEIVLQINANYKRKLSRHEIQQYAFFCKVLARSKQDQFKALLTQVRDYAPSKGLRRYVKGYLTEMEKV